MDSFSDAFLKANLVTPERIKKVESDKRIGKVADKHRYADFDGEKKKTNKGGSHGKRNTDIRQTDCLESE